MMAPCNAASVMPLRLFFDVGPTPSQLYRVRGRAVLSLP